MQDWALIRRLAAEGVPNAAIARRLSVARNTVAEERGSRWLRKTVARALASNGPPEYERRADRSGGPVDVDGGRCGAVRPAVPATQGRRLDDVGPLTHLAVGLQRARPCLRRDPRDRVPDGLGDREPHAVLHGSAPAVLDCGGVRRGEPVKAGRGRRPPHRSGSTASGGGPPGSPSSPLQDRHLDASAGRVTTSIMKGRD